MIGKTSQNLERQAVAVLEHHALIGYLEDVASRKGLTLKEVAKAMGLNPSQIYNIRSGQQPGLKVCRTIAQYTGDSLEYILYLAGHIDAADDSTDPVITALAARIGNIEDDSDREEVIKVLNTLLEAKGY